MVCFLGLQLFDQFQKGLGGTFGNGRRENREQSLGNIVIVVVVERYNRIDCYILLY